MHQILKKIDQAYFDKDVEGMMKLYVQDPDLVAIGAGRAGLKDRKIQEMDLNVILRRLKR